MPEIGRINGLIFQIFDEIGAPHHLKHVRVIYGEFVANYDLRSGQILAGRLPPQQDKIVKKIIRKNRQQFIDCWDALNSDTYKPFKKLSLGKI